MAGTRGTHGCYLMEKHETKTEEHEPVTASHKNPGERKEAISRLLAGYGRKKEGGKESFGFRYITLAGTLVQDDRGIRLMDEFDVYEYSKKEATLVLKNVTVENIDQHLENLK